MESNYHLRSKGGGRREWSGAQGRQRGAAGVEAGSLTLDKGLLLNLTLSYTRLGNTAALSVPETGFGPQGFVGPGSRPPVSGPCLHLLSLLSVP